MVEKQVFPYRDKQCATKLLREVDDGGADGDVGAWQCGLRGYQRGLHAGTEANSIKDLVSDPC